MTSSAPPPARRILIVGSTFGQLYLDALRWCSPAVSAVGLLARGSERSKRLADTHGIPLLNSIEDVPEDIDLVCIAVRADSVGGVGTTIATQFLERGISVLHELPASSKDVTICLRSARRTGARFAVADLYQWLPAVQAFQAAARELIVADRPLALDAHLSIQPAYALARLLTEIGLSIRPVSLKPDQGGTLVAGTLGSVPVAVRYATVLDAHDTDNDVRFPAVSLHTSTGTLLLANVHGPVLWIPTLHLPANAKEGAGIEDKELSLLAASTELFHSVHTHSEMLKELWPQALAAQISAMFDPQLIMPAQRTIQVAQLWESLTNGVQFPAASISEVAKPRGLALRELLLAAAQKAIAGVDTSKKDENSR